MNKQQLIDVIMTKTKLSKTDASHALKAITDTITKTMSTGDSVQLTGFGAFSVKQRKARNGRNPQTGAIIQIPASQVVAFKAGKTLIDVVNR